MKKVIVDYKKLPKEVLALLSKKYPNGYEDSDIVKFRNVKNELVEALEVDYEDTKYLVKVNTHLSNSVGHFEEEDDLHTDEEDSLEIPDIEDSDDTEEDGK